MLAGLVWKELLALRRDLHGLAALFLMPLLFFVIMALALRDQYDPPLSSLPYALDVRDDGALTKEFTALWQQGHGPARPLPGDWQAQLQGGRLKYVVVLDAGLTKELALLALPQQAFIHLLADPGIDINLFNALRAEVEGIAGQLKARGALLTLGERPGPAALSQKLVSAKLFAAGGPRPNSVQQNVAAWLVFGMFFVIAALSNLFVEERRCGALARLRSLGVPPAVLLASKALPYLGVNLLQAAMMLAVGAWLMPLLGGQALALEGVNWPALVLVVLAIGAAAVSLALMLSCLVRTPAQALVLGPLLNVLMAALGGIMVPTFVMPASMQKLAACSPMNWGMEGLLTVLMRGGGISSTSMPLSQLLLFAALMAATAGWLLTRKTQ